MRKSERIEFRGNALQGQAASELWIRKKRQCRFFLVSVRIPAFLEHIPAEGRVLRLLSKALTVDGLVRRVRHTLGNGLADALELHLTLTGSCRFLPHK